jgi:hypothetical protein
VAKVKHLPLRRRAKINLPEKQPSSPATPHFSEKLSPIACRALFLSPTFAAPKRKTVAFSVRQTVW